MVGTDSLIASPEDRGAARLFVTAPCLSGRFASPLCPPCLAAAFCGLLRPALRRGLALPASPSSSASSLLSGAALPYTPCPLLNSSRPYPLLCPPP